MVIFNPVGEEQDRRTHKFQTMVTSGVEKQYSTGKGRHDHACKCVLYQNRHDTVQQPVLRHLKAVARTNFWDQECKQTMASEVVCIILAVLSL